MQDTRLLYHHFICYNILVLLRFLTGAFMALKSQIIHVIMLLFDLSFSNKLRKNLILLITFLEFIVPDSKTVKLSMMTLTSYLKYEFVLFDLANRKHCWLIFMTHQCTIHNIVMKQFQNVKYILYCTYSGSQLKWWAGHLCAKVH